MNNLMDFPTLFSQQFDCYLNQMKGIAMSCMLLCYQVSRS